MILPILIIFVLLASALTTAQAVKPSEKPNKNNPTGDGTLPSGKDINITSPTHFPPGQLNLDKLKAPPALKLHNLTASAKASKNPVDTVRLTLVRKSAMLQINTVIRQLELYKKQISHSRLSDDEQAALIAMADNNIAWYRQQGSDIQAAADIETINDLANATHEQTAVIKADMKQDAGIMACDQLDGRIATARDVSAAGAGKIADLKAAGNDTAALERSLADFDVHVNAASQYSAAARTAFEGISGDTDADSGFSEGYQQIRLADLEMQQAYVDLKDYYILYLQSTRR